MLLGEKDDWVPPQGCLDLAASQPKDAAEIQVKVYPGAFHSFDRKHAPVWAAGHRLAYDADATQDAQRELQAFLHRYLD
jgi:dienelactone hydrolase